MLYFELICGKSSADTVGVFFTLVLAAVEIVSREVLFGLNLALQDLGEAILFISNRS